MFGQKTKIWAKHHLRRNRQPDKLPRRDEYDVGKRPAAEKPDAGRKYNQLYVRRRRGTYEQDRQRGKMDLPVCRR